MGTFIDIKTKTFFDKKAVTKSLDRAEIKSFSKIGAFIRRRHRSLLRRRKKISRPGHPPSVHSKDKRLTLKNIRFIYDRRIHGVAVGIVLVQGSVAQRKHGTTVPKLMEMGGAAPVEETVFRTGTMPFTRIRRATYRKRPSAAPALEMEVKAGTIPAAFRGSVHA